MDDTHALIIAGKPHAPPAGLHVTNFLDPDVPAFEGRDRKGRTVDELIVHESVTRSARVTTRVLQRRKLGVHLIVDADGAITQHADLAHQRLAHAGHHNARSVGIEVVNPYYPRLRRDDLPWQRIIFAPWAHKNQYLLPTPEQADATARLVGWLASRNAKGLQIPRRWVGVQDGHLRMGRLPGADESSPGIYAHHYFGHADGAWLVLYAWLRLTAGLPPSIAYERAVAQATGARKSINLDPPPPPVPVA